MPSLEMPVGFPANSCTSKSFLEVRYWYGASTPPLWSPARVSDQRDESEGLNPNKPRPVMPRPSSETTTAKSAPTMSSIRF